MSEWVTLSRHSPAFRDYLLGSFSKDKRALPVTTLNVNRSNETVTFRVVPLSQIDRPGLLRLFLQGLKVRKWLLVLVPMLLVLLKNISYGAVKDPISLVLASFGVLFLYISNNLRNDFVDHYWGIDRVLNHRGSRAIQQGWLTAIQVRRLSQFFLWLAFFCGLPCMVTYPSLLGIVGASTLVILISYFFARNSVYYQLSFEMGYFLLIGPLFAMGYQVSMGASLDNEVIFLGLLWGWLVLFEHHLSSLIHIMTLTQAGFKNFVTLLGFDRSRRALAFWWVLFVIFFFFFLLFYGGAYWAWYCSIAILVWSPRLVLQFKRVRSPLGSDLVKLHTLGRRFFLSVIVIWLISSFWTLL